MKINPNLFKSTPKSIGFGICIYGDPTQDILEWCNHWNIKYEKSGPYTNFILPDLNLEDIFDSPKIYQWIDGFSPNLNKHLHLGHLSNLIIAKSIQSMGLGNKYVAILGDTLDGKVDKNDALKKYNDYCGQFGYHIDDVLFASEQSLSDKSLLKDGDGEYDGTKIFDIDGEKIVGVKSNGSTSYFYQDVCLCQKLNDSTLYLTGFEQSNHFSLLKKLYPQVDHIGLGLVLIDGKKMSSSEGNVLFLQDIIDLLLPKFNNDLQLVWNVLVGQILKSTPNSVKNISLKQIENVKQSPGLYLSYTMAKMWSAGIQYIKSDKFVSQSLAFKFIKAKNNIQPNMLLEEVIDHAKKINQLYITHRIKDNPENIQMFQSLTNDLVLGMDKLGFIKIDKV